MISEAKDSLHQLFKLKDLGELKYFLGIEVLKSSKRVILNQRKYILKLIAATGLTGAKPASTPLESNLRITSVEHDLVTGNTKDVVLHDITSYQRFVVQNLSQFMQSPKKSNWEADTRVVGYLNGTVGQCVWLKTQPTTMITCWCDSDSTACSNTKRFITSYESSLGNLWYLGNLRNNTVSRSSAEAEYRSMASVVSKVT
ncbi:uncharacterized mitochondrial protein AtMg00810-like [Solanum dulcamara]|uniref:uncharacterized mitochondrial protein AtMg00810-like n=1 Tax=Solanum dulcamara TaxID=45834 RepID=UPI002486B6A2|nr:uncharacterized mitochondrial protein AtMg00810-like [Solanum dulcamara]